MNVEFEGFAQQGWQCPICKHVYSPITPMCYYCGNGKQFTITTTGIDINPGHTTPIHDSGSGWECGRMDKKTKKGE